MNTHNQRGLLTVVILAVALSGCCCPPSPTSSTGSPTNSASDKSQPVTIDAVVRQVQDALNNVQPDLTASGLPAFKSVKLSLQTVRTAKATAEVDLSVVTVNGSYEKDRSQEFDITLIPTPPPKSMAPAMASVTQPLEDAIRQAVGAVHASYNGNTPLTVSEIDVVIGFTVIWDGSGTVGFSILPVGGKVGAEFSKSAVHTITVTYGGS